MSLYEPYEPWKPQARHVCCSCRSRLEVGCWTPRCFCIFDVVILPLVLGFCGDFGMMLWKQVAWQLCDKDAAQPELSRAGSTAGQECDSVML